MNLNKVFLVGRLTKDPVLRSTQAGGQVASFAIATNKAWTDKEGNKKEQTEFHNVIVWGKLAETATKFLIKGQECLIEGRLQTRNWDDKQGQKRYTTEVVADLIQFGQKPKGQETAVEAPAEEGDPGF